MPPGGAILASAASVRIITRKPSLSTAIGKRVRWAETPEYLQSPHSSPREEHREALSPISGLNVRRMFLEPELPINTVDLAVETAMDTFVGRAPAAVTATAASESASAAAPKTKLKGFSFGGSSKGKKGGAFQEWKRGKPEKPSEPAALVLRREEDAVVPKSLAPAADAKTKAMLGTDHADWDAVAPSLPLSLMDTVHSHAEKAKTARRSFGTPAPGPILMPFV